MFSNAIGYGIDQFVMRRIPIRRFSVLLALLPVTALAVGWIALDQQPSGLELVGVALVLVGVATQEREELDRDDQSRMERTVLTEPSAEPRSSGDGPAACTESQDVALRSCRRESMPSFR